VKNYVHRETCRLCTSRNVSKVFALAPTPLANAFVTADKLADAQDLYPLDVWFCNACGHLQLLDVVDPSVLYAHYVYVSGTSPVFVRHFKDYAAYVIDNFQPAPAGLVVDIGSNDGTLLRFFKDSGRRVLGVDPAQEISEQTRASGIPVLVDYFSPVVADRIRAEHGAASVIAANNVIAHIDDLAGVMEGVRRLLAPDGVFVFEVSYLGSVVENTLFDTIYHEHIDYHSVTPLQAFFDRCGLELIEAVRVDSHGGSLRGVVQIKGGPRRQGKSVRAMLDYEEAAGLNRPDTYAAFANHVDGLRTELTGMLHRLKSEGKRIAGFGAPAKLTTLMYHFGLEADLIDFVVDDSPLKQGHFTPGMHIPVVPAQELYNRKPDYVVILAWNFAKPIIEKHSAFREAGGRFIVPLPKVEVI
jgi:SAM-dependent methyltransferase